MSQNISPPCPYLTTLVDPECELGFEGEVTLEQVDRICGTSNYLACIGYLKALSLSKNLQNSSSKRPSPESLEKSAMDLLSILPEAPASAWDRLGNLKPFIEDPRR